MGSCREDQVDFQMIVEVGKLSIDPCWAGGEYQP